MATRTRRLGVAAIVLSVALAGCGGGDDGGGRGDGDEYTYVRVYEKACKTIIDAPGKAREEAFEIDANGDPGVAIEQLKTVLADTYDGIATQLDAMAEANAPDKYADFQEDFAENVDEARDEFDRVRMHVADIESLQDIEALGSEFDELDVSSADLPAELAKQAPSCGWLDARG